MSSQPLNHSTPQASGNGIPNRSTPKAAGKISLRTVLIVPFVLQIFAAVGLVGWLSYRSGQQAVNDVASQLQSETANRIQERLRLHIEVPHLLNQVNANAIASNQVNQ